MLFQNTNGWFVLYLTCKRKCKKIRLVYQVSSTKYQVPSTTSRNITTILKSINHHFTLYTTSNTPNQ